ncbi:leucine-rich repeat domain-containing protein [Tessaracoccus antarcticus]|uniref:Leucine-rich repeat domain-containing protein n=1 Tax=Tessaracoccus antarcticus TaxID=2479848 RepID=A0A3M0GIY1_9ACTN|nr:leucine-rich repeat domain-containing protein [Tessaracoccus antarcticus]RMB57246.1 leucine-rich repeat domain-containing protein [Tessaracoccus antarcticus]
MKRKVALVLAAVVVAASTLAGGTLPARAEVNVYTTEGIHNVNGREWKTTCEPYSQTKRCRTEIKATQISQINGRFVAKTDWAFNNLTYLPSARSLWKTNPLGNPGNWSATDGRRWYTECDNATTGNNGCRSYAEAKFIESYQDNGKWNYRWVTKFVFNNIVMFTTPTPPVKPTPPAAITMPDVNLRECINDELGRAATAAITKADAAKVTELACDAYGVGNLAGLENFTNLEVLWIDENNVKSLAPLKGLKKLEEFTAYDNNITDLTPLASLTSLLVVDVAGNAVVDVAPLSKLTRLLYLDLTNNNVAKAAPLASLPNLEVLGLFENPVTDKASLQPLLDRGCEIFFDAPIS